MRRYAQSMFLWALVGAAAGCVNVEPVDDALVELGAGESAMEGAGCIPSCWSDKACGPDGCGGSCGTCPSNQVCAQTGICLYGECGYSGTVTPKGCCLGRSLLFCSDLRLIRVLCKTAQECGWDPQQKQYACGTTGGEMPGSGPFWVPRECPSDE